MVGAESPAVVDFAKPHLRELVAGLFMEGHLEPCRHPEYESFAQLLARQSLATGGTGHGEEPPVAEECRLLLEGIKGCCLPISQTGPSWLLFGAAVTTLRTWKKLY